MLKPWYITSKFSSNVKSSVTWVDKLVSFFLLSKKRESRKKADDYPDSNMLLFYELTGKFLDWLMYMLDEITHPCKNNKCAFKNLENGLTKAGKIDLPGQINEVCSHFDILGWYKRMLCDHISLHVFSVYITYNVLFTLAFFFLWILFRFLRLKEIPQWRKFLTMIWVDMSWIGIILILMGIFLGINILLVCVYINLNCLHVVALVLGLLYIIKSALLSLKKSRGGKYVLAYKLFLIIFQPGKFCLLYWCKPIQEIKSDTKEYDSSNSTKLNDLKSFKDDVLTFEQHILTKLQLDDVSFGPLTFSSIYFWTYYKYLIFIGVGIFGFLGFRADMYLELLYLFCFLTTWLLILYLLVDGDGGTRNIPPHYAFLFDCSSTVMLRLVTINAINHWYFHFFNANFEFISLVFLTFFIISTVLTQFLLVVVLTKTKISDSFTTSFIVFENCNFFRLFYFFIFLPCTVAGLMFIYGPLASIPI